MDIKISNTWKKGIGWVNVNGAWKKGVAAWVNVNGTWKRMAYAIVGVFKGRAVKMTYANKGRYREYTTNWQYPSTDPETNFRSNFTFRYYGGPTSDTTFLGGIQFKTFPDGVSTDAQKRTWLAAYLTKIEHSRGLRLYVKASDGSSKIIDKGSYTMRNRASYSGSSKTGTISLEVKGSADLSNWGKSLYDKKRTVWFEVVEL